MSTAETVEFARQVMDRAWADLPPADRSLLEAIRAEQRDATVRPLGVYTDELRRSAGYASFPESERQRQDAAAGLWIPELRLVLLNAAHTSFQNLDQRSLEWALARVAWHEWGHALAFHRATNEDVSRGEDFLELAPLRWLNTSARLTTVRASTPMRSSPRSTRCCWFVAGEA